MGSAPTKSITCCEDKSGTVQTSPRSSMHSASSKEMTENVSRPRNVTQDMDMFCATPGVEDKVPLSKRISQSLDKEALADAMAGEVRRAEYTDKSIEVEFEAPEMNVKKVDEDTHVNISKAHDSDAWFLTFGNTRRNLVCVASYVDIALHRMNISQHTYKHRYDHTLTLWKDGQMFCAPLKGHQGKVSHCAFSPDDKMLASVSFDKTAMLWSITEKGAKALFLLEAHKRRIWYCEFTFDGRFLVTAAGDNTLAIWDTSNGKMIQRLEGKHTSIVNCCATSSKDYIIASGSFDKNVVLWDCDRKTGKSDSSRCLKGHSSFVFDVSFSVDGKTLASSSQDRTVRVWDVTTGTCLHVLKEHNREVMACRFSSSVDSNVLVSVSGAKPFGVCRETFPSKKDKAPEVIYEIMRDDEEEEEEKNEDLGVGTCVCVSSNGDVAVLGTTSGTLVLVSGLSRRKQIKRRILKGCHDGPVRSCSFSKDMKHFASCSSDGSVALVTDMAL